MPEPIPTGYIAADGYERELADEIGRGPGIVLEHGRLILATGPLPPGSPVWASNVWIDPVRIDVASISAAARALKSMNRWWVCYARHLHRRSALVEQQLPRVQVDPVAFPDAMPEAMLGSWTLLDEHTLLASPTCSSPFPHGEVRFVEDRTGPPSRAYLKLWEALTLMGEKPCEGSRCLDLGASPGGWTWALQRLGACVVAVDKAELDPAVAGLPRVELRRASAFSIDPVRSERFDWVCSDVACYPRRLLSLVRRWIESGNCDRMVCTIKLQGRSDVLSVSELVAIPGATVRHLAHNRHELTFLWKRDQRDWIQAIARPR